jgi:DNA integrity scanning protein DisA with diadenylate cyclase activity
MNIDTTFQKSFSRNTADWKFTQKNGRLTLAAVNGGVAQRCAQVLKVMKDYKTKKPIAQGFIYVKLKDTYSLTDVMYALHKMEKINIVRKTDIGWALTAKGYRVLKAAEEKA